MPAVLGFKMISEKINLKVQNYVTNWFTLLHLYRKYIIKPFHYFRLGITTSKTFTPIAAPDVLFRSYIL